MTRRLARALRGRCGDDAGMTLIELLVSMLLFSILSTLFVSVIITATGTMQSTKTYDDLNEEARLMLNRMSMELRQAKQIQAVVNPGASSGFQNTQPSSITFWVDFNGNGAQDPNDPDQPEVLTYTFDATNHRILLSAGGSSYPILAGNVSKFEIDYGSKVYQGSQDLSGLDISPHDGTLSWQELDADPTHAVGNGNGVLDSAELAYINSVTIQVTVLTGAKQQSYETSIDLRNHA
jgi:prepilin-type N-terminal cleavage/methylation domain-containing protein